MEQKEKTSLPGDVPEATVKRKTKAIPAEEHVSDAGVIQVLDGLEAVRLRPGMYIGGTGEKGLHHILWEIVDNAVDEAANGYADRVDIVLYEDGSVSVEDNGRGIPVDINPIQKKSGVELVFTVLHAGGKFDNKNYKFSGGLHGVGASVTNALSTWLKVQVFKNKQEYVMSFHSETKKGRVVSGIPDGPLQVVGPSKKRGSKITFLPDPLMFGSETLKLDIISRRVQELAFLNKGIEFTITDHRVKDEEGNPIFHDYIYKGGLVDFVKYLNTSKNPQHQKILNVGYSCDTFEVELAMQYTDVYVDNIISYVNNIPTTDGGTHETGFKAALTRCMNEYRKRTSPAKTKDIVFSGEDFRDGLTAVLSVKLQEVQFEGQTKTKLGNPEVRSMVESALYDQLDAYFKDPKNKDVANAIIKVATENLKVRDIMRKDKEIARAKNSMNGSVLGGKFASCSGRDATINELFIVEGDSAGGSAKQGRDRRFQAILPLRGKPLNSEKKRKDQIIANEEIRTIIYALGTDFDKDFNIKNLKFDKIIILADADQDGAHIRSILLTFFYRYMRELVSAGHVYIGMPPLYKVEKKGIIKYAYDDAALDKLVEEMKPNYKLQRYKGLGEMNPEQLWATTLDPARRTLMRVTLDDIAQADYMVSTLMGDNVEARRAYIYENANFNKEDAFADKYGK